jgi:hypothetical protein
MQTLGLSESAPRTESRLRSLFWPTLQNEGDFDYVTAQGFWVCVVVAAFSIVVNLLSGNGIAGLFDCLIFFLAGLGVRQRSRFAAVTVFLAYLLNVLVAVRYTGRGFGVAPILFLALLFANIRGNWLSSCWKGESSEPQPIRLNETNGDKLSNQLPAFLWPKIRVIFYVLMTFELLALLAVLLGAVKPKLPTI